MLPANWPPVLTKYSFLIKHRLEACVSIISLIMMFDMLQNSKQPTHLKVTLREVLCFRALLGSGHLEHGCALP